MDRDDRLHEALNTPLSPKRKGYPKDYNPPKQKYKGERIEAFFERALKYDKQYNEKR